MSFKVRHPRGSSTQAYVDGELFTQNVRGLKPAPGEAITVDGDFRVTGTIIGGPPVAAESLQAVLIVGNSTAGSDIILSPGDAITTTSGSLSQDGNVVSLISALGLGIEATGQLTLDGASIIVNSPGIINVTSSTGSINLNAVSGSMGLSADTTLDLSAGTEVSIDTKLYSIGDKPPGAAVVAGSTDMAGRLNNVANGQRIDFRTPGAAGQRPIVMLTPTGEADGIEAFYWSVYNVDRFGFNVSHRDFLSNGPTASPDEVLLGSTPQSFWYHVIWVDDP